MKVAFCRAALAHPGRGDAGITLDRARHRPAHRLRRLGGEIATDREEAVLLARIHDRQLAALQLVAPVRIDLVDHLDQGIAALDQDALLAIAGEDHVVARQRHRSGHAGRLLAGALHVEAGLALPLPAEHPLVESAGHGHVAEHRAQRFGIELGIPGPMRAIVVAQHADQAIGEIAHRFGRTGLVRARLLAGLAHIDMAEIHRVAGAEFGFGNMQRQSGRIVPGLRLLIGPIGHYALSPRYRDA